MAYTTRSKKKAFTLIEMLAVVGLIAILFIIFIPRIDFATNKTKEAGILVDFRSYQIAFSQSDKIDPDILNKTGPEQVNIINKYLDSDLQIVYEETNGYSIPNATDPWGTNYKFISKASKIYLLSAGPDKQFSDTDDSIIRDLQHGSMVVAPLNYFTVYAYSGETEQTDTKNLDNYALIIEYDTDDKGLTSTIVKPGTSIGGNNSGSNSGEDNTNPSQGKLQSISVTKQPDKTSYFEGENFDPTGMEVTATYSDGKTKVLDLSSIQIIDADSLFVGQEYITISYTEDIITVEGAIAIAVIDEDGLTNYYEFIDDTTATGGWRVCLTDEFKSAVNKNPQATYENWNPGDPLPVLPSTYKGKPVTNMSLMFYYYSSINSLDLSNFDTSNVKNMSQMFDSCTALKSLNIENFNTSSVTNMSGMFYNCSSLTSLELLNFDTSNVQSMSNMFKSCSSLISLDLSNFETSNVTTMYCMFQVCRSLVSLDLSSFDTSKVMNTSSMFGYCDSLNTCYGRTQTDCNKFNSSSDKPSSVNFIVKA